VNGREITCGQCRGHGLVSDYSTGDFEGAMDCPGCAGQGYLWRYDSGILALWHGGPLWGRECPPRAAETVPSGAGS
jgi:hypothetical protein